jgi:predicted RNA-binding protein associated with RNAse of E/G family
MTQHDVQLIDADQLVQDNERLRAELRVQRARADNAVAMVNAIMGQPRNGLSNMASQQMQVSQLETRPEHLPDCSPGRSRVLALLRGLGG